MKVLILEPQSSDKINEIITACCKVIFKSIFSCPSRAACLECLCHVPIFFPKLLDILVVFRSCVTLYTCTFTICDTILASYVHF